MSLNRFVPRRSLMDCGAPTYHPSYVPNALEKATRRVLETHAKQTGGLFVLQAPRGLGKMTAALKSLREANNDKLICGYRTLDVCEFSRGGSMNFGDDLAVRAVGQMICDSGATSTMPLGLLFRDFEEIFLPWHTVERALANDLAKESAHDKRFFLLAPVHSASLSLHAASWPYCWDIGRLVNAPLLHWKWNHAQIDQLVPFTRGGNQRVQAAMYEAGTPLFAHIAKTSLMPRSYPSYENVVNSLEWEAKLISEQFRLKTQ